MFLFMVFCLVVLFFLILACLISLRSANADRLSLSGLTGLLIVVMGAVITATAQGLEPLSRMDMMASADGKTAAPAGNEVTALYVTPKDGDQPTAMATEPKAKELTADQKAAAEKAAKDKAAKEAAAKKAAKVAKEEQEFFDSYEKGLAIYENESPKNGNYWPAIKALSRAIELKPDHENALFLRAASYSMADEHAKAIDDYSRAIEINKDLYAAYVYRGWCYYELQSYDKALSDFNHAVELEPDNALAYFYRSFAYDKIGESEKASTDRAKASELDPKLGK